MIETADGSHAALGSPGVLRRDRFEGRTDRRRTLRRHFDDPPIEESPFIEEHRDPTGRFDEHGLQLESRPEFARIDGDEPEEARRAARPFDPFYGGLGCSALQIVELRDDSPTRRWYRLSLLTEKAVFAGGASGASSLCRSPKTSGIAASTLESTRRGTSPN